jgi:hypothetical protein
MFELSQIILWILWRLRPVMAVEANLVDILQSGFALFRDDETLRMMADDPDYCATVTAALADAHAKLDLLIYLRACETHRPPLPRPRLHPKPHSHKLRPHASGLLDELSPSCAPLR